ncbi:Putative Phosphomevalonate kinase [Rhizopus microsporus]|nr:Putative Phosphomevalonate kinase [Rhizopus microsporus]
MSNMVIASAPGKVLITGGYLVLEPEYTGTVIGTSSRFYTVIQPGANGLITNQHQPIHLPKWNSVASNLGDDSASVISFGQTSHVNFDTESASVYRSFMPASTRSRNSNGAESITSSNALQS